MATYKFMRIYQVSVSGNHATYAVENKKSGYVLGVIYWYAPWRQYILAPGEAIFSVDCMKDIISFMEGLK